MKVLEVNNLYKSFKSGFIPKKTEVLKSVSFSIEPGTVTGFLGANGAGKTTTIKSVLGLIFPDSGTVKFFGEEGFSESARRKVGFLPERPYFYDYLTGQEFLLFYGKLSGVLSSEDLKNRANFLLKRVGLDHAKDRKLRDFSKGMLQRVGVAQALIHRPEFVILDEPMSGLDPDGRFEVSEIIRDTAKEGTAVFFSSHLLNDVEKLCSGLVVVKEGRVIFDGSTEEILERSTSGFTIKYKTDGKLLTEKSNNLVAANLRLSALIKSGAEISYFRKDKIHLEDAFVKIAYGEKSDESHLDNS